MPEIPEDGSFKIAFTGNIGYAQGLDILPRTAQRLKALARTGQPIRFVIIGDGRYKPQLLREIREKKVEDMFVLIDRQPAERIPHILAACDAAFVSFMDNPLFSNTIPAKLQSYLACAMPVVAAASGETERIVREADCGVCCKNGDSDGLAQAIIDLLHHADRERYSRNARRYFEEHFEKEMLLDRLEDIIESVHRPKTQNDL